MYNNIKHFLKELKEKYPRWVLPTKISLALGLVGVMLGIAGLFLTIFPIDHNDDGFMKVGLWGRTKTTSCIND